jgi:transposase
MEVFRRGSDFAAWLGLVPVQHTTGGKQVLGKTSKMGRRDIRRLLISGAMVIVRWACRKGAREETGCIACSDANRACLSRSPSPTKWPVRSGLC